MFVFFGIFSVLSFLETPVFRFALLSYYQRTSFASTLEELLPILESKCEAAINYLYNKIIVNSDKFQVILVNKRGSDNTNIEVK